MSLLSKCCALPLLVHCLALQQQNRPLTHLSPSRLIVTPRLLLTLTPASLPLLLNRSARDVAAVAAAGVAAGAASHAATTRDDDGAERHDPCGRAGALATILLLVGGGAPDGPGCPFGAERARVR